jgi:hypothetical protein
VQPLTRARPGGSDYCPIHRKNDLSTPEVAPDLGAW